MGKVPNRVDSYFSTRDVKLRPLLDSGTWGLTCKDKRNFMRKEEKLLVEAEAEEDA